MGTKGCFGHISTYCPHSRICQQCNEQTACASSVSDRVQRLRKLGVSVEMSKSLPDVTEQLVKPKTEPNPPIAPLSGVSERKRGIMTVKARETYAGVEKRGVDLKAGLMGLFNPLDNRPKFLSFAFDKVIKGGYKKRDLAEAFCKEFGWTRGTANSHVSICTSIFTAVGIVKVDGQTVGTVEL